VGRFQVDGAGWIDLPLLVQGVADDPGKVARLGAYPQESRMDAGDIQQVIDQDVQAAEAGGTPRKHTPRLVHVAGNERGHVLAFAQAREAALRHLDVARDGRQRGAHLVAGDAQELVHAPVGLAQRRLARTGLLPVAV